MVKLSKIEAESMKLCGYKVIRTKHKYYLTGNRAKIKTGYMGYL